MFHVAALLGFGALVIVLKYITQSIHHRKQAKAWGCKPVRRSPDILGISTFLNHNKALSENRWPEFLQHEYNLHGTTHQETLLGQTVLTTSDPENLKAILSTQFKDFCVGPRYGQFYPLAGASVFTLDGAPWSHARAQLRPQFSRDQVTDLSILEEHVTNFVNLVPKDRSAFDIQPLFFMFTLDASSHFLLGESIGCMLPSSTETGVLSKCAVRNAQGFAHALDGSLDYLAKRSRAHHLYWLINPKEFRDMSKQVQEVFEYYVHAALEAKGNSDNKDGRYTFLRGLVADSDDPKKIRDALLSLMVAGRDTTATMLASTFFYLARYQSVWSRLRREILELFGDVNSPKVEITHARLKDLRYLQCVLNEVLRMQPAVPFNTRTATRDTTLPVGGGVDGRSPIYLRKGENLTYCVYSMHRRKDLWGQDANEFRPERWEENPKRGWEFLPFNGGPRVCIGQQYAITEVGYVVVRLLQHFDTLEGADPHPRMEPVKECTITLSHALGVPVRLYSSKA
ncbi:Cytochrome P450 52A12 [Penicillium brevicompactum]|uniref:uncharacterized protein n=1 Tax=Penicillium brevicompactum TaxID=5074 RepID=UPI002541CFB9|nr:uncharacterized protein N7506_003446 [Penicillium brevicompactum]KAJ5343622.1 hypothetical protein N7506_003446 [Penicillium brevicompactum]